MHARISPKRPFVGGLTAYGKRNLFRFIQDSFRPVHHKRNKFRFTPGILLSLLILFLPLAAVAAPPIDEARVAAAGIRKLPGRRLTLYTDVAGDEIDRLPALFEQAFPQWCKYFGVKESDHANWHLTGCLMKDKRRFATAGLLPHDLPPFEHGYSTGQSLWLYDQPTDFYRRELLLHEGTHCFTFTLLGSCGPPWYMEGLAEYLGTHRLADGRLTLGSMPRNRDEAPGWGRVRIIQDAVAQRRALKLNAVIEFSETAHRETEPYAWCWAAATLLDRHPRYRDRFRQLIRFVREPDFNDRFHRLFESDWQELCEEWQLMVANMEYGYDVERSAVDFRPGKVEARPEAKEVTIAADRGWQNTGIRLEAGKSYRLMASGRYQVARTLHDGKPLVWWCEPGGVSIRYYKGRPLGVLLAAVRSDHPPPGSTTALLRPTVVGLGATLAPAEGGTLFLKINDSPGELDDNAGELKVEVRQE
jgi:hypothetical protein